MSSSKARGWLAWILLAAALCGCSPARGGPSIPVLLDEAEVGALYLGDLTETPQPLELLLDGAAGDPRSWLLVEARSRAGRSFRVHRQAFLGGAGVFAFVDAEGTPRIGLFPTPNPDPRSARLLLVDPVEVHLRTVEPPPPPPPPPAEASPLRVRVGMGESVVLAEDLLASVPLLEGAPVEDAGGGGAEGSGDGGGSGLRRVFHLADVVAAGVDVQSVTAVRIVGADGAEPITIDGHELRSREDPLPILKRNRKGLWVFQLRAKEPGKTRTLRPVTALELTVGG